jgi:dolichyl-phosphate-mannose-protein mannosyltransferase
VLRSPFSRLRRSIGDFARSLREDAPLFGVLFALLLVGVILRVYRLDDPKVLKWDEGHYVNTARAFLAHQYLYNDHPPLSKLMIAGVMAVLGDTSVVWRLLSLIFGLGNLAIIAWSTWAVFRSRRAAWIAAAFVAADGFFIAFSRTALLDGIIVALGLLSFTILLVGRRWWHVLLSGLLVGCATSFKLSGLAFLGTAMLICLASRALRRFTPLLVITCIVVFWAQASFALWLVGRPFTPSAVLAEHIAIVKHNLSFTFVHPMSSHWYTWFLPTRPIFLRRDVEIDGSIRALVTLGNPLLWWASTLAVVATAVAVIRTGPRRIWALLKTDRTPPAPRADDAATATADRSFLEDRAGALLWVLAAWAAPIVFWIPSLRDAYVYHFMPSYAFGLILLAGLADRMYRRYRLHTLLAVVLVAEVTLFYAPIWSELPLTQTALHARLFFPFWR